MGHTRMKHKFTKTEKKNLSDQLYQLNDYLRTRRNIYLILQQRNKTWLKFQSKVQTSDIKNIMSGKKPKRKIISTINSSTTISKGSKKPLTSIQMWFMFDYQCYLETYNTIYKAFEDGFIILDKKEV